MWSCTEQKNIRLDNEMSATRRNQATRRQIYFVYGDFNLSHYADGSTDIDYFLDRNGNPIELPLVLNAEIMVINSEDQILILHTLAHGVPSQTYTTYQMPSEHELIEWMSQVSKEDFNNLKSEYTIEEFSTPPRSVLTHPTDIFTFITSGRSRGGEMSATYSFDVRSKRYIRKELVEDRDSRKVGIPHLHKLTSLRQSVLDKIPEGDILMIKGVVSIVKTVNGKKKAFKLPIQE